VNGSRSYREWTAEPDMSKASKWSGHRRCVKPWTANESALLLNGCLRLSRSLDEGTNETIDKTHCIHLCNEPMTPTTPPHRQGSEGNRGQSPTDRRLSYRRMPLDWRERFRLGLDTGGSTRVFHVDLPCATFFHRIFTEFAEVLVTLTMCEVLRRLPLLLLLYQR